jgi:VanZ family protein
MSTPLVRTAAWLLLALLAFVTLAPIGLRPMTVFGPNAERFAAFLAMGTIFALAYPRRFGRVAAVVLLSAVALEAAQHFVPTRHGTGHDLLIKLAGASLGLVAGRLVSWRAWHRSETTGGLS